MLLASRKTNFRFILAAAAALAALEAGEATATIDGMQVRTALFKLLCDASNR
jgi:ABC-type transport system substrate-binding protein